MPVGVHVVLIDVGDGRKHRREIQKRGIGLIGFGDDVFAGTEPGVGAGTVESAADHIGGIKPPGGQKRGRKRGRRGLAVRPGNRNTAAQTHEFCEHHRARHHRNMGRLGGHNFRIVGMYGAGNHDGVGAFNVFCVMPAVNHGAEAFEPAGGGIFSQIRAAYGVTEVQEHLGDAAHPGATDTDKMQMLDNELHNSNQPFFRNRSPKQLYRP